MKQDLYESSVEDISRGFGKTETGWACLICGEEFTNGVIYSLQDKQYEAWMAVSEHVRCEHGSVFKQLTETEEKYVGLTAHQANVLTLMLQGLTDKAIAEQASSGNPAVIRNLRFQLKEREKQAKAFLAAMEAFRRESKNNRERDTVAPHAGATMADERFDISAKQRDAVLKLYFDADGSLKEFPVREKRKVIALREISARFSPGRTYTEREVNELIAYHDFATVRRYLIEYGFLVRSADCREYRVKEQ